MSGVPGVQFFVRDAALWAQVTPVAERLPPGRAALQDALDAAGLGVWSLDDDVLDRLVARCAEGFEAGELMLAAARPGRFTLEIAPDGLQAWVDVDWRRELPQATPAQLQQLSDMALLAM